MLDGERKELADKMLDQLPDDPIDALVTVMLLAANVAISTGVSDVVSKVCFERAYDQMKAKGHGG